MQEGALAGSRRRGRRSPFGTMVATREGARAYRVHPYRHPARVAQKTVYHPGFNQAVEHEISNMVVTADFPFNLNQHAPLLIGTNPAFLRAGSQPVSKVPVKRCNWSSTNDLPQLNAAREFTLCHNALSTLITKLDLIIAVTSISTRSPFFPKGPRLQCREMSNQFDFVSHSHRGGTWLAQQSAFYDIDPTP